MSRPKWFLQGKRLVPWKRLCLNPGEPAFYQGLGLFETVGCQDGKPLLWSWHRERLLASARELFTAVPLLPREEDLCRLLQAADLAQGPAALRVVWWWGRRAALAWAKPYLPPWGRRRQGAALVSLIEPSTLWSVHKTTSHLPWKLAAWRVGGATALLVEPTGEVREADSANVFAVFGDTVVTPPAPPRGLPGILRRFCLQTLPAWGFSVEEKDLTLDQLLVADGVFLTSSLAGVVPVKDLDTRPLPRPERVLQVLAEAGIPAPGYS